MQSIPKQTLKDNSGQDIAIILPIDEYKDLLKLKEDLEDIRAYEEAKADVDDEMIPWEQAKKEMDANRLKLKP
jgi:hypothetical protein